MSAFMPSLGKILASGFLLFCLALSERNISLHWEVFKDAFLRAQELSASQYRKKKSRRGRKLAWFGKGLLVKLRDKKKMYKQ